MEQLPTDAFLQQQRFTRATHRDIYPFIAPTAPSLSQANRIIAITGASQGLGHLAFAHSFALAGAKALILGARNVEKLEKVKAELDGEFPKTEVVALRLDVRNEESQEAFWKVVSERWGRADVVICNAGVDPGMKTVKEIEGAVWWDAMVSPYSDATDRRTLHMVTYAELTSESRKRTSKASSSPPSTSSAYCPPLPQSSPRRTQQSSTYPPALPSSHPCRASAQTPSPSSPAFNCAPTLRPSTRRLLSWRCIRESCTRIL